LGGDRYSIIRSCSSVLIGPGRISVDGSEFLAAGYNRFQTSDNGLAADRQISHRAIFPWMIGHIVQAKSTVWPCKA